MGTLFFKIIHPSVPHMLIHKAAATRWYAWLACISSTVFLVTAITFAYAHSPELRLNQLDGPITLKAIVRSDNGKLVGMQARLGRSYLKYKAFKGRLELGFEEIFDVDKIAAEGSRRRYVFLDDAIVYRVLNGAQFMAKNTGRVFIPPGHPPTYITIKSAKYVDGANAVWICVLSAPTIAEFYRTLLGHERCDAFR
jgi:hypothetical protein